MAQWVKAPVTKPADAIPGTFVKARSDCTLLWSSYSEMGGKEDKKIGWKLLDLPVQAT